MSGFTLLELILVLGILGAIALSEIHADAEDFARSRARQLGVELYQFNSAIRNRIVYDTTPGSFTGTSWLKEAGCGGLAPKAYLPCSFGEKTDFGRLNYSTVITNTGGIVVATTTLDPLMVGTSLRPDLSGLAAMTASAGMISNLLPVMATTSGKASSNPTTSVVTLEARDHSEIDAWLRVDGANEMQAPLSFDPLQPAAVRVIENVAHIVNKANEALSIGDQSIGSAVIINSDAEVVQNLTVRGQLTVSASLVANGSIISGSDINSGRDLAVARNLVIAGDTTSNALVVTGNAFTGRTLGVTNNLNVTRDLRSNSLTVTRNMSVADQVTTSQLSVPAVSQLQTAFVRASIHDTSNTGFRIDPNAYSRLGTVRADTVLLEAVRSEGGGCSNNGNWARKADGAAMTCVAGRWTGVASAGGSGAAVIGLYYGNSLGYHPSSAWGAWSAGSCSANGGIYVTFANSSRRRTSQGIDFSFLCLKPV